MWTAVGIGSGLKLIGDVLLRYGLIVLLLWLGAFKFTEHEARAIEPLIRNSPLLSWLYGLLDVASVSRLIGSMEITIALLILLRPLSRRLLLFGGLGAVGMFLTTLSFLLTTPGMFHRIEGVPVPTDAGAFLIKDLLLLAAACVISGEALAPRARASHP